jgi:hypothetical protein
MNLSKMTEAEFLSIDGPRRLNEAPSHQVFFKLEVTEGVFFGIAGSNDSIPPQVEDERDIWIGVDSTVVSLDRISGRVLLLLPLPSRFHSFQYFDDLMLVLCETDVVVFNKDHSVRALVNVGEIIAEAKRTETTCLRLTFVGGETADVEM